MSVEFTKKKIQEIAGDALRINDAAANGNFKLDLVRLVNGEARDFSDTEKVLCLVKAHTALREAGYEVDIRLSQKNSSGQWTAWPHLWVNKTTRTSTTNNAIETRMAKLEANLAKLVEVLTKGATSQEAASEQPIETAQPAEAQSEDILF
jgi:hypothetical protein